MVQHWPRGRNARCSVSTSRPSGHSAATPSQQRSHGAPLREKCKVGVIAPQRKPDSGRIRPTVLRPDASDIHKPSNVATSASIRSIINLLLEDALGAATIDKKKLCLDLFRRTGHISRRFRRLRRGAITIDLSKHPLLDLLNSTLQDIIVVWIRSGKVAVIFMAPVCARWSRARSGPLDCPGPLPHCGQINSFLEDQILGRMTKHVLMMETAW